MLNSALTLELIYQAVLSFNWVSSAFCVYLKPNVTLGIHNSYVIKFHLMNLAGILITPSFIDRPCEARSVLQQRCIVIILWVGSGGTEFSADCLIHPSYCSSSISLTTSKQYLADPAPSGLFYKHRCLFTFLINLV